jgi:endonuclease YncB( thermonuclease family)
MSEKEFRKAHAKKALNNAIRHLKQKGIEVKLPRKGQWTTLKGYCEKYNIENVEILEWWIESGRIPADHIRVFEELKDKPYGKQIRKKKYKELTHPRS